MPADEAVQVGNVRHDVVGDDRRRRACLRRRGCSASSTPKNSAQRRDAGGVRRLRLVGRRVDAEHGDAALDEVPQQVAVVARQLDHEAVARRAPRCSMSCSACSRECSQQVVGERREVRGSSRRRASRPGPPRGSAPASSRGRTRPRAGSARRRDRRSRRRDERVGQRRLCRDRGRPAQLRHDRTSGTRPDQPTVVPPACSPVGGPAQVGAERALAPAAPDVLRCACSRGPGEVVEGQAVARCRRRTAPRRRAHGPLRLERRAARCAILSQSTRGSCACRVRRSRPGVDACCRHDLLHDLGDLADPVVLRRAADVERLVVHDARAAPRARRGRRAAMSSMCTSGRHGVPSLFMQHLAGRERAADEVVDHEVAAQAGETP